MNITNDIEEWLTACLSRTLYTKNEIRSKLTLYLEFIADNTEAQTFINAWLVVLGDNSNAVFDTISSHKLVNPLLDLWGMIKEPVLT